VKPENEMLPADIITESEDDQGCLPIDHSCEDDPVYDACLKYSIVSENLRASCAKVRDDI